MSMSLSFALECPVCLRHITYKRQRESAQGLAIALASGQSYAVCPGCKQKVEDPDDAEYRASARRFVAEQAVVELIKLNPQLFKKETSQ